MLMASKLLMSINWTPGYRKSARAGVTSRGLRLHVLLELLFRRLVRLAAVALRLDLLLRLVRGAGVRGAYAGQVDAELLGRTQQVVVLVADLDARALLGA